MSWALLRIYAWYPEGGPDDTESNEGDRVIDPVVVYGKTTDGGRTYEIDSRNVIEGSCREWPNYVDPDDGDDFDIIPPDEWTDEMCAKIALLQMGIEGD